MSSAAPHEARQETTPSRDACYRAWGAQYSVSPVSSVSRSSVVATSSSRAVSSAAATSKAGTPTASTPAASATVDAFAAQMLKLHNDFRAQYGGSGSDPADFRCRASQVECRRCGFRQEPCQQMCLCPQVSTRPIDSDVSSGSGYGENLAAGVGGGYSAASGFNAWANEACKSNL